MQIQNYEPDNNLHASSGDIVITKDIDSDKFNYFLIINVFEISNSKRYCLLNLKTNVVIDQYIQITEIEKGKHIDHGETQIILDIIKSKNIKLSFN